MRVLVLGSNSISGSAFIAYCLKQGAEVIGVSRRDEIHDVFLPYKWESRDTFKFFRADINHDLDQIRNIIDEWKPSYVVNFASQSMVAESWKYPIDWYRTNVVSTIALHEKLRTCSYLEKYIHISTPEVYGCTEGVVTESRNYNPSTPYATSRAAADMSLWNYFKVHKFPVVFTRSANIYGAGQQLYRIIPRTIYCALSGEKLNLQGGGTSQRSFISTTDVSEGTFKCMLKGEPGDIFHFSTERLSSIREIVGLICERMGIAFDDLVHIAKAREGHDAAYRLDSQFAKQKLDWTARTSLEEGIDETIEWAKDNYATLQQQTKHYIHQA